MRLRWILDAQQDRDQKVVTEARIQCYGYALHGIATVLLYHGESEGMEARSMKRFYRLRGQRTGISYCTKCNKFVLSSISVPTNKNECMRALRPLQS